MKNPEISASDDGELPLIEGLDFYFDDGLMVLTADYLRRVEHCCGSGCRNCPYGLEARLEFQSRNSSNSL